VVDKSRGWTESVDRAAGDEAEGGVARRVRRAGDRAGEQAVQLHAGSAGARFEGAKAVKGGRGGRRRRGNKAARVGESGVLGSGRWRACCSVRWMLQSCCCGYERHSRRVRAKTAGAEVRPREGVALAERPRSRRRPLSGNSGSARNRACLRLSGQELADRERRCASRLARALSSTNDDDERNEANEWHVTTRERTLRDKENRLLVHADRGRSAQRLHCVPPLLSFSLRSAPSR